IESDLFDYHRLRLRFSELLETIIVGLHCVGSVRITLPLLIITLCIDKSGLQTFVRSPCLIDHCNPHRPTSLDAENQRRHHPEECHDKRTEQRCRNKDLRTHALKIFTLNYRQELCHETSL